MLASLAVEPVGRRRQAANNLRKVEQCLVLNDLFGSALPCFNLQAR